MTVNIEGLGEITADGYVLNIIASAFFGDCAYNYAYHRDEEAKKCSEYGQSIYHQLSELGYYKDV